MVPGHPQLSSVDAQPLPVLPQPRVVHVQLVVLWLHLRHRENVGYLLKHLKVSHRSHIVRGSVGTSEMLKDPKGTTHLLPFVHTEDSVGVVAVLADAVQLDRVAPRLAQVLTC